jgi:hypothetical protein
MFARSLGLVRKIAFKCGAEQHVKHGCACAAFFSSEDRRKQTNDVSSSPAMVTRQRRLPTDFAPFCVVGTPLYVYLNSKKTRVEYDSSMIDRSVRVSRISLHADSLVSGRRGWVCAAQCRLPGPS